MFLERRTVSRKTPTDGKLEITQQTAQEIEALGTSITLELAGETGTAAVSTMECMCRNAAKPHVHYFLESERFKSLQVDGMVDVELAGDRVLVRASD